MFDRVKGFFLGLVAPIVMVFGFFLAIPDMFRYMRMRRMSKGTLPHA